VELLDTFRPERVVAVAGSNTAWADSARAALSADPTVSVEVIDHGIAATTSGNDDALLAALDRLAPDVVVLTVTDDPAAAFSTASQVFNRFPATKIMVVTPTGADLDPFANAALDAGVAAAWTADRAVSELADAVHAVARGGSMLPPSWAGQALAVYRALQSAPAAGSSRPTLNADEAAVLEALAEGAPEAVVAAGARVPLRKVRVHAGNAWHKLIRFRDDQRALTAR
jgi:DNA-binding NarL/FixJ family response regulator